MACTVDILARGSRWQEINLYPHLSWTFVGPVLDLLDCHHQMLIHSTLSVFRVPAPKWLVIGNPCGSYTKYLGSIEHFETRVSQLRGVPR